MLDAVERVSGRINYVLNFELPGMLVGKILRSPVAHARLLRVESSRAARLAGVGSVLTREDFGAEKNSAEDTGGYFATKRWWRSTRCVLSETRWRPLPLRMKTSPRRPSR